MKLLQDRIDELKRQLIPEPQDTADLLHNEGIMNYIEIYEQTLERLAPTPPLPPKENP